jgi:Putative Flp pilus-assembly TadE/G-like
VDLLQKAVGRARGESGQAIGILVLSIVTILGVCALTLDVGSHYVEKRNSQDASDSLALAAAQKLLTEPTQTQLQSDSGLRALQTADASNATLQLLPSTSAGGTVTDTVRAVEDSNSHSAFAGVLSVGLSNAHVTTEATAQLRTLLGYGYNTAPFAIDQSTYSRGYNVPMTLHVQPGSQVSPGNFGAIDLVQTPGCSTSNGTANYRNMIDGQYHSCGLSVGGTVPAETGRVGGNTCAALNSRDVGGGLVGARSPFDPVAAGLWDPTTRSLSTFQHPNLLVIPVIQAWGNGKSTLNIVDFEYFIITSYSGYTTQPGGVAANTNVPDCQHEPDTGAVEGYLVNPVNGPSNAICPTTANPYAPCATGTYNPNQGISTIKMIG